MAAGVIAIIYRLVQRSIFNRGRIQIEGAVYPPKRVFGVAMYNLTGNQKALAEWFVQSVKQGKFNEEFVVVWGSSLTQSSPVASIVNYGWSEEDQPEIITQGALDALKANSLIWCNVNYKTTRSGSQYEINRRCTLTGKIYEAVNANFNAPDTSFIKYLTPLADVGSFDENLKQRCLPILGAGGADPMLWDTPERTAGVILEERLHDVGFISDPNRTGRDLVNDVFGKNGTLASKFAVSSERDGYRDLYAGIVGVFRNPSAHRLIDPSPEDGGAFIVFVNLLLKKLEALR